MLLFTKNKKKSHALYMHKFNLEIQKREGKKEQNVSKPNREIKTPKNYRLIYVEKINFHEKQKSFIFKK